MHKNFYWTPKLLLFYKLILCWANCVDGGMSSATPDLREISLSATMAWPNDERSNKVHLAVAPRVLFLLNTGMENSSTFFPSKNTMRYILWCCPGPAKWMYKQQRILADKGNHSSKKICVCVKEKNQCVKFVLFGPFNSCYSQSWQKKRSMTDIFYFLITPVIVQNLL